jgi:AlkA N-terminal domain
MRRRYGFYGGAFGAAAVALAAVWTGVVMLGDSWLQLILAGALGLIFAQLGFLGPEACHRQIFRSARWNEWWPAAGTLSLRLPLRTPFAYEGVFGHLAATAVPGCEEVRNGAYRRTLRLPSGSGIVSLTPTPDHVRCLLVVDDFRDVSAAIARCRRLLDLDADPEAVVWR